MTGYLWPFLNRNGPARYATIRRTPIARVKLKRGKSPDVQPTSGLFFFSPRPNGGWKHGQVPPRSAAAGQREFPA